MLRPRPSPIVSEESGRHRARRRRRSPWCSTRSTGRATRRATSRTGRRRCARSTRDGPLAAMVVNHATARSTYRACAAAGRSATTCRSTPSTRDAGRGRVRRDLEHVPEPHAALEAVPRAGLVRARAVRRRRRRASTATSTAAASTRRGTTSVGYLICLEAGAHGRRHRRPAARHRRPERAAPAGRRRHARSSLAGAARGGRVTDARSRRTSLAVARARPPAPVARSSSPGFGDPTQRPREVGRRLGERRRHRERARGARRCSREAAPGIAFFGEESGGERAALGWIVDPLDGTANFLHGFPAVGVSVALVAGRRADRRRRARAAARRHVRRDRRWRARPATARRSRSAPARPSEAIVGDRLPVPARGPEGPRTSACSARRFAASRTCAGPVPRASTWPGPRPGCSTATSSCALGPVGRGRRGAAGAGGRGSGDRLGRRRPAPGSVSGNIVVGPPAVHAGCSRSPPSPNRKDPRSSPVPGPIKSVDRPHWV